MPKKDLYKTITDKIIEKLDEGTVPWKRPYSKCNLPVNWVSQKMYRGINMLILEPGEYATFKQIKSAGGIVKKGEKAHTVVFWKMLKVEDKDTGEDKKIPMLKEYKVFEINTQVEGLKSKRTMIINDNNPIDDAETIVNSYFKQEKNLKFTRASGIPCYNPSEDRICMPKIEDFTDSEKYYSTFFHEMCHSTGHKTRLDREGVIPENIYFGSKTYSKEELIAEIGASILCSYSKIDNETFENNVSYIDNWLDKLKNDKTLIVKASQKAQKATDLILNVNFS